MGGAEERWRNASPRSPSLSSQAASNAAAFCAEIGISANDLKAGRLSEKLAARLLALKSPHAALFGLMGQALNFPPAPDADDKPTMLAHAELFVKTLGAIIRAPMSMSPTTSASPTAWGGGTGNLPAGADADDEDEVLLLLLRPRAPQTCLEPRQD